MKINPKELFQEISINFLFSFKIIFLLFLILLSVPPIFSVIFDFTNGKEIINNTLTNIIGNTTNPDEKALAIMVWERDYFYNPYSYYNINSTIQKFGVYKINGNHSLFIRPAPVSWIIYSRLANCEEYARVFVFLMNEAGIKANLILAQGEDHVWAEYKYKDYKIAVDPSQNIIIGSHKQDFEKKMNVKFSYVQSIDLQGNKIDVSDEYIDRGNLTIIVFDNGKPVTNVQVTILNPSFMINRSDRYNKPIPVLSKSTGNDGIVFFKLGSQKYNVKVRIDQIYLIDSIYQKNITVDLGKENVINFDLEKDEKNNEVFITRYI